MWPGIWIAIMYIYIGIIIFGWHSRDLEDADDIPVAVLMSAVWPIILTCVFGDWLRSKYDHEDSN